MRLRQIEVFHAIYSSGTITSAAAMLNVSQPSVSKVLAHAEQQLGYQLFERRKGKLIPTPEAHQLFKHVSDVYRDIDRLQHVASNLRRAQSGRVRIAATPAFGLEILPRAIATFREQHADIVFEIETLHLQEINNALLETRVDVGIAFDPISNPAISEQLLATGRFFVIAPVNSKFAGRSSVTVADIAEHPIIGLNDRGPLGRLLSAHVTSSDVELDVVAWCETYHVAKSLVGYGAGITIADEITAHSNAGPDVHVLELKPTLRYDIKALHLANSPLSIIATEFVSHIKGMIGEFMKPA